MKLILFSRLVFALLYSVSASALAGASADSGGDEGRDGVNVEQAWGSQKVRFISLRNIAGEDPEDLFGDERDVARTGVCDFSSASMSFLRPLSDNGLIYIPENKITLEAIEESESGKFWEDFRKAAQGQRPILYVHGYNTGFVKGCEQAALFQANLKLQDRLLLFSWPSDGAILNYARDEADLFWSVAPLEATLKHMVEQFGEGGFDVLGHSLGARGVFFALVQLAHGHDGELPLVNQLVFTAPDIDAGVFVQYLADIRPLARYISLYVSDNDRPLALSREVHGYPRLGQTGEHLDKVQGIDIIDVSNTAVQSFSGHLYHLYNPRMLQDLGLLLNAGQHAAQRQQLDRVGKNRWRIRGVTLER
jgi:esterase/lipase superfamily enzyme